MQISCSHYIFVGQTGIITFSCWWWCSLQYFHFFFFLCIKIQNQNVQTIFIIVSVEMVPTCKTNNYCCHYCNLPIVFISLQIFSNNLSYFHKQKSYIYILQKILVFIDVAENCNQILVLASIIDDNYNKETLWWKLLPCLRWQWSDII